MKRKTSMVMLLVIIGAVLLSGCMNQSDNEDEVVPIDDKTIDPPSEGVAEIGTIDHKKDTYTVENRGDPYIEYEEDIYVTDLSSLDSIVEFNVENRGDFDKEVRIFLKISYSFKTQDGVGKREANILADYDQKPVTIAPGDKKKFTIDIRESLRSSLMSIKMEDFEILSFGTY